jgi:hypothetical protein
MDDHGLSKDLARILKMEEQIRETPAQLRAVFACGNKHIWQEFDLPIRESVRHLEIAKHFQLVPLLRALKLCTPHCAAIVEHDKTRAFILRGLEIHEMEDISRTWSCLCTQTVRVGAGPITLTAT